MQVKKVGKYEIGKTLGEGTFGKVKYAVNTDTGEKVRFLVIPALCALRRCTRDRSFRAYGSF